MIDLGAAYGTAKSGVGIASMGVLKPELIFKSIVPIIMAGILGIYGLIVAVILQGNSNIYLPNISSLISCLQHHYRIQIQCRLQASRIRTDLRSLIFGKS